MSPYLSRLKLLLKYQLLAECIQFCLINGFVFYCNFREGRVQGIVEVSRSIGDGRFKHCGVIATPDVFRTQLTDNDV